jgi:hypothetical protein
MDEARRHELHVDAAPRERSRERMVVGQDVAGWVDQVHAHAAIL